MRNGADFNIQSRNEEEKSMKTAEKKFRNTKLY